MPPLHSVCLCACQRLIADEFRSCNDLCITGEFGSDPNQCVGVSRDHIAQRLILISRDRAGGTHGLLQRRQFRSGRRRSRGCWRRYRCGRANGGSFPCWGAIAPKTRGQEEKLGTGLNRLNEEDPTFTVVNNAETHQMVVSGAGDIQIDVLVSKLKTRFGVDAELDTPRVPYREKIRKTVQKQGRHKKQTGGSGQFGDVWVRFEPNEESEEMVFAEEVFGGSVPKNFFPAVEKGLREAVLHGPLAGYPVVNLKCVLYDGSYHPVDSSEIAFKTAANLAYKAAMPEASPVLLEPVCELKVTVPDQYMGDILGDLNKRRGRVMGMTPTGDGEQIIEAECPEAELMSYAIDLRSMTQSRGSFTMHFVRYEQCSADAQEKAVAAAKAMQEAE